MKCDELKPLVFSLIDLAYVDESAVKKNFGNPHNHAVYKATKVDEAIAELKAELAEKDKDIAYWREEYDKETQLTDALKDEIESLKASHYAESVDAGMRERSLRRALWLARAYSAYMNKLYINADWYSGCEKDYDFWTNTEEYCRAKAEEYK